MRTSEIVIVSVLIVYVISVFSFVAYEYSIQFEDNKNKPILMVELFGNGSSRRFEVENPSPDPDVFTSIFATLSRFSFAMPFAITGLGIIGAPIGLIQNQLLVPPEGFRVMVFWIAAMITIPLNYLFTKNIPLWRRIPYLYFFAAIVSGTPLLLSENFGR